MLRKHRYPGSDANSSGSDAASSTSQHSLSDVVAAVGRAGRKAKTAAVNKVRKVTAGMKKGRRTQQPSGKHDLKLASFYSPSLPADDLVNVNNSDKTPVTAPLTSPIPSRASSMMDIDSTPIVISEDEDNDEEEEERKVIEMANRKISESYILVRCHQFTPLMYSREHCEALLAISSICVLPGTPQGYSTKQQAWCSHHVLPV